MARTRRNQDGADDASDNNSNNNQLTIILGVYLHCEACVKPMINRLKAMEGVEDVIANFANHNLIVKGQKDVDPKEVAEKLWKKYNKEVIIIAPKLRDPNPPKEEKKEEPKIVLVTLNMYVHCENCGNTIKHRIKNMPGVQDVQVNVGQSQVVVKGEFEPQNLVEYVDKRMGKLASIAKIENLSLINRRRDRRGDNNENSNNNNNRNGGSMEYVPFQDDSQYRHLFNFSDQMFNDENTEACNIM